MRVIAGSAKGVPLQTISERTTRPTIDRIKENLFNIIRDFIPEARVVDFFSGSGALCIEALSRGAERAILIEANPKAVRVIRQNLAKTKLSDQAEVWPGDFRRYLDQLAEAGPFSIIFIDPPHRSGLGEEALHLINRYHLLENDGIIIGEHHADEDYGDTLAGFERVRQVTYGNTAISIYMKDESDQ
ncbi:MAG TPA: 16S rRNA (guanine(966)-N(2))-methyltransferase RsmD [Tissierellia bacterium]|nr:16S rRNA (guanine(966)-N(2))-methyltransferase RsmD [Tissierellia bacterium]